MADARLCDKCSKVFKAGDTSCVVDIRFGEKPSLAVCETKYSGRYFGELCPECGKWLRKHFDIKLKENN